MEKKFYVYALRDGDTVAYVGKGSGYRLRVQQERFGLVGDKLEEFDDERAAYQAERKWIKELKPELNKHPGGNGCVCRKVKRERKPKWLCGMELIGTRRYSALLLLACERSSPGIIDASKIDAIRQVACGAGA